MRPHGARYEDLQLLFIEVNQLSRKHGRWWWRWGQRQWRDELLGSHTAARARQRGCAKVVEVVCRREPCLAVAFCCACEVLGVLAVRVVRPLK